MGLPKVANLRSIGELTAQQSVEGLGFYLPL
jgi:hypothetical protein